MPYQYPPSFRQDFIDGVRRIDTKCWFDLRGRGGEGQNLTIRYWIEAVGDDCPQTGVDRLPEPIVDRVRGARIDTRGRGQFERIGQVFAGIADRESALREFAW